MSDLTANSLADLLDYDASTGVFTWRVRKSQAMKPGCIAGTTTNREGYRRICINGEAHYAHRLAWLYVYGKWPSREIDHIDGDAGNNAISNLREATGSQNQFNQGKKKHNRSGHKGVTKYRSGWRARIACRGAQIHLGYFDNAELAAEAYAKAAERLHGEFARIS